MNIKIEVQRVGLNLRQSGLSSTYRARVYWLGHGAAHSDTDAVFSSFDAGSVRFGHIRTAKGGALSARQRSPAIATTAGVFYARTLTHTRALVAGLREALDIGDLEEGPLQNLYKIAHYEFAVDKWDNFAEAILESGQF